MNRQRWLIAFSLLFLTCWAGIAAEQQPSPERPPAGRLHNLVLVADRPTPLFWAEGISDPEEMARYRDTGLNTVVVPITGDSPEQVAAANRLATAATKMGLFVIARLAPSPAGFRTADGELLHPSARTPAYRARVRQMVERVAGLRSPLLVAWEIAGVDPDYLLLRQADLAADLTEWYGSVAQAGAAWGYPELTADLLSDELAAHLDRKRPQGMGRAVFDLACHRQLRYRQLLALWAEEIKRVDPGRLVFAGNVHYYRSAMAVPRACDGMVVRCLPTRAEGDLDYHNPHAVDAARRGNAFAALPTIMVDRGVTATQIRTWTLQAALHGAAGIGYTDWGYLLKHPELHEAVTAVIKECRRLELVPRTPQAQVAVLCEPFAAGALARNAGLWGHVGSLSCSEPGVLIYQLRAGWRYGLLDLLALEDVEQGDLAHYRLLLAPLALQITDRARAALLDYAAAGGIVMADWECGRFSAPGQPERLDESLAALFGVVRSLTPPARLLPLVATYPHPLYPSLGTTGRTLTDPSQSPFTSEVLWVQPRPEVLPAIVLNQAAPTCYAGLLARPVGRGWTVYASCRLWEYWLPGRPFFDALFADMLSPRCELALAEPDALVPAQITASLYADGAVIVSGARTGPVSLLLRTPGGRLMAMPGGVQAVPAQPEALPSRLTFPLQPLVVMSPVPITATPLGSQVLVQVAAYNAEKIQLVGFGAESQVHQVGERLDVAPRGRTRCGFTVLGGGYPVAPGSKHRLEIQEVGAAQPTVTTLEADAEGRLRFIADCTLTWITVTPISE